jgi:Translation elongation factors (GTPases)
MVRCTQWIVRNFVPLAGRHAFSEAFKNANPKILEPIYDVEVLLPSDKMGDVMSDLQSRRAIIMGMSSEKGLKRLSLRCL